MQRVSIVATQDWLIKKVGGLGGRGLFIVQTQWGRSILAANEPEAEEKATA